MEPAPGLEGHAREVVRPWFVECTLAVGCKDLLEVVGERRRGRISVPAGGCGGIAPTARGSHAELVCVPSSVNDRASTNAADSASALLWATIRVAPISSRCAATSSQSAVPTPWPRHDGCVTTPAYRQSEEAKTRRARRTPSRPTCRTLGLPPPGAILRPGGGKPMAHASGGRQAVVVRGREQSGRGVGIDSGGWQDHRGDIVRTTDSRGLSDRRGG